MVTVEAEQMPMLKIRLDLLRRKMQRYRDKRSKYDEESDPIGIELLDDIMLQVESRYAMNIAMSLPRIFDPSAWGSKSNIDPFEVLKMSIKEQVTSLNEKNPSDSFRAVAILEIVNSEGELLIGNDQLYCNRKTYDLKANGKRYKITLGVKLVRVRSKPITHAQYKQVEDDLAHMTNLITRIERIKSCTLINDIRFKLNISDDELSAIVRNNSKFDSKKRESDAR